MFYKDAYEVVEEVRVHVVDTIVHDCSCHSLSGETKRPRSLHVQIESGRTTCLPCVVLKIDFATKHMIGRLWNIFFKCMCTYDVPLFRVEWVVGKWVGFCVVAMSGQLISTRLFSDWWISSNLFVSTFFASVTRLLNGEPHLGENKRRILTEYWLLLVLFTFIYFLFLPEGPILKFECGKCFSWSEHALRHRGGSEIHWPSQEAVEKKTFQHVNNNVTSAGEFGSYRCDEGESVSFGNMTRNFRSDVIMKFDVPVVSDDISCLSQWTFTDDVRKCERKQEWRHFLATYGTNFHAILLR